MALMNFCQNYINYQLQYFHKHKSINVLYQYRVSHFRLSYKLNVLPINIVSKIIVLIFHFFSKTSFNARFSTHFNENPNVTKLPKICVLIFFSSIDPILNLFMCVTTNWFLFFFLFSISVNIFIFCPSE